MAKHIGCLEEAFLFFSLSRFSFKAREQAAANRKIYCIDNGMITARGVLFSADTGRLVENLVAVALRKRALDGACELFFWKDAQQREVDFVIKEGRSVTQLIQVCCDLTATTTREREIRALLRAGADLSCDRLLLLTADTDSEEVVEWYGRKGRIRLLPGLALAQRRRAHVAWADGSATTAGSRHHRKGGLLHHKEPQNPRLRTSRRSQRGHTGARGHHRAG